jgi:hypothetical protein
LWRKFLGRGVKIGGFRQGYTKWISWRVEGQKRESEQEQPLQVLDLVAVRSIHDLFSLRREEYVYWKSLP